MALGTILPQCSRGILVVSPLPPDHPYRPGHPRELSFPEFLSLLVAFSKRAQSHELGGDSFRSRITGPDPLINSSLSMKPAA
jgi:hypothetical protein